MSFRTRLAIAAALAVTAAVVTASLAAYLIVRGELRDGIDESLRTRAGEVFRPGFEGHVAGGFEPGPGPKFGGAPGFAQLVSSEGDIGLPPGVDTPLPVSDGALAVARGESQERFEDQHVEGLHLRVLSVALPQGGALQIARPLDEVDDVLDRMRTALLVVGAGGVALAAMLGLVVSGAAIRPLRRLTVAAEEVARTRDLSQRVGVTGEDEIGRLGTRFDEMLAALEESRHAQRQLIADASHELRTPLTSLKTNIEVLTRDGRLEGPERQRLLDDVIAQLDELTALVSDVVELARTGEREDDLVEMRLDEVVDGALERVKRRAPGSVFVVALEPDVVLGAAERIDRAVTNLLDNAVEWNPPGEPIEVTVRNCRISVRDHGPGIDPDDLPHVFDRFYRADAARGKPGSGLGLAIVRQVADAHGGKAWAEPAEGGGTRMVLELNGV
jgi:two-component system sensor histidine kinase MprB